MTDDKAFEKTPALTAALGVVAASWLVLGASAPANGTEQALAQEGQAGEAESTSARQASDGEISSLSSVQVRQIAVVRGEFSATQQALTPTEQIARRFGDGEAASYLCSSTYAPQAVAGAEENGELTLVNDKGQSKSMVLSNRDEGVTSLVMGCACTGNPSGGLMSVNANVTGITIASLMERAGATTASNTVVFVSKDGYQVSLPLNYVLRHQSLIAFAVNGRPLSDSMGGTNQLWLGSTSARYFARDIVSVAFEAREPNDIPDAPSEDSARVPNVAVESISLGE